MRHVHWTAGTATQASSQACQHSRNSCIFASCHHRLSRIKEYKYMYQTTLEEIIVDSFNLDFFFFFFLLSLFISFVAQLGDVLT